MGCAHGQGTFLIPLKANWSGKVEEDDIRKFIIDSGHIRNKSNDYELLDLL